MVREIFEVYAKVVDANGNYTTLSGYPKTFDTRSYEGNYEKARQRAYAAWHKALSDMGNVDSRQVQYAMLFEGSTGRQLELFRYGKLPEDPDPEPEPEQEA